MPRVSTRDAARGSWKGILLTLGVDARFLTGKHGPCPSCGGTDRFRWDNRNADGGYICSRCGSGNGFDMLKLIKGWDFATAAREVDAVVGNVKPDPPQKKLDEATRVRLLRELWAAGVSIASDNPAARYLGNRRLDLPRNRKALRFVESCPIPKLHGGGQAPAMIGLVTDGAGQPVNIHRTFLKPDGSGKADMEQPRAMMPGNIPDGSAIRLTPVADELGIAEGIETALAATRLFDVPTWAAVNEVMLGKWFPPEGVRRVVIFGDNDANFVGNSAAFSLAKRLHAQQCEVVVRLPECEGSDWADDLGSRSASSERG